MFNSLGSLDVLRDAVAVDLFAGSGALGIEALSRGAAHVIFADVARRSIDAVRANLAATDLDAAATVIRRDAFDVLADGAELFAGGVDLVLADPPYAFDRWGELLVALEPFLAGDAVVAAESDRSLEGDLAGDGDGVSGLVGWSILRERRYGDTVVSMLTFDRSSTIDRDRCRAADMDRNMDRDRDMDRDMDRDGS